MNICLYVRYCSILKKTVVDFKEERENQELVEQINQCYFSENLLFFGVNSIL